MTNEGSNNVSVIDTAKNTFIASVYAGNLPAGDSITPDGKTLYVANQGSKNVTVIDTATKPPMSRWLMHGNEKLSLSLLSFFP